MPADLISLLARTRLGDRAALDELVPIVYNELHRMAARYLRQERTGHTLQPTALVNEAYLRLIGTAHPDYLDRAHFLGVAAYLMRQILTDHARRRQASKRGGGVASLAINEALDFSPAHAASVTALDDALTTLAAIDPEQARLVELRFYAGMTAEEIAELTGATVHRVRHRMRIAMAWLNREMRGERP